MFRGDCHKCSMQITIEVGSRHICWRGMKIFSVVWNHVCQVKVSHIYQNHPYSQARPFLSICLTFIWVEWQVSLLLLAHPIGTVITMYLLYSREDPCNMYCPIQDISLKWHDYHHQLMSELRAKWESICSVWCLVSHHYPRQHARSPTRPKVHNQRNDHHIEILPK